MSAPKGIDWSKHALGSRPDSYFAGLLGVSSTSVCTARNRLGIPSYRGKRVDWDAVDMGLRSDAHIAAGLGVHQTTVCKRRLSVGVESNLERQRRQRYFESEPRRRDVELGEFERLVGRVSLERF